MIPVSRLMAILCLSVATAAAAQSTAAPQRSTRPAAQTTPDAPTPPSLRATEPVTAETDKDVNNSRAMKLSLDEALRTAIRQNLGVELQRYEYRMAGEQLRNQYGVFDPVATADLSRSSKDSAALSAFDASSQGAINANAGIRQFVPTGGAFQVGMTNQRFTRAGAGTTLSPGFSTGLSFAFDQPLARNFGTDINRRGILIARNTLGINDALFRSTLLDTTNNVEQAYYNLIYTRQFVDVVKESVFLARDQSRITQIRIDVGASAPLDILQPRVQVATTEEQLIAAVADVRAAEDRLRQLLNLPQSDWDRPILPTDTVQYTPMAAVNVQDAVNRAYARRPEIQENALTTATRQVTYLFARNQVLPQFDLNVGYGLSGAGGRVLDPTSGVRSTGFGNALNQVFRADFPGWNAGLTIGVPVFNIGARAEARRAQLDVEQSKTTEEQTRQNIAVEVRSAVRAIDTTAKEITASRAAREAAEQNLDAERKRYENGMTTNFQVLQVQQQLSDARARELQALVAYNQAITAYHRATGDLLDVHNITVGEPSEVTEPSVFSHMLDQYNFLKFASHDHE